MSAKPRNHRFQLKYARIKAEFNRLYQEGFRNDIVCQKLEEQFNLSPNRIREIVRLY